MLTVSPSSMPCSSRRSNRPLWVELAVEVHTGLVIVEVDIVQELLEPLAGHDPQIVVALDLQLVRVARARPEA